MEPASGARTFAVSGDAYDQFMGRYSQQLAAQFATFAKVEPGQRALDVGCGPGALTVELRSRLGAEAVAACDPSESFVAACRRRNPGVDVRSGSAEALPFEDGTFDLAISQLVLHFVSDPSRAAAEMQRVLRPGGMIAACVWDFDQGMQMLRLFWDAALSLDPDAPEELQVLRFGRAGEIAQWLEEAGLEDIAETTITVSTTYAGFDELWSGFLAGIGPAGSYCMSLPPDQREALRGALQERVTTSGPFSLEATALAGRAIRP